MTDHPHEGMALLQACLSQCKVTHLLHTVPSSQIAPFIRKFDDDLRKAFSSLLLIDVPRMLWRVCVFKPRHGGVGIPSGCELESVYFLMSLLTNRAAIAKHCPGFEVQAWVDTLCSAEVRRVFRPAVAKLILESVITHGNVKHPCTYDRLESVDFAGSPGHSRHSISERAAG